MSVIASSASLSATMWSARVRRIPPSIWSGEPKSMTQGSSPAACRMPTAPSSRVTSHMLADIIIGWTSSTGEPAWGCPGRLSGGKYRRSLYIGTLSTTWDGMESCRFPDRRVAGLPGRSALSRSDASTGRVTAENFKSMPPLPRGPTCAARGPDSVHITAHRRRWARCLTTVPSRSTSLVFLPCGPPGTRSCCAARIVVGLGRIAPLLLTLLRSAHRRRARVGTVAHLLGAEAVHLEYPTKVVLGSVTVGVSDGDRIGIVGRNGDGKSSLLGLLTGEVRPHLGRVTQRSGLRVGALSQAETLDPHSTVGWTLVGDRPDHEWAGEPRIRDVVGGLVADIAWDAPIGTLSGGQRRRIQLATLLVGDWDVIALDEPTNHLDIQGITWLAAHLRQRWARNTGGLLLVTHDRWFLDEVATSTWEVHDGIVEPFEGGYAAYVLQRLERDRQNAVVEAKRQNLMRKELAWLRRGPPARTSKPKFRIDAANQLIADVPPLRDTVELAKLATARLGKDVIDLLDVSVSFDGQPVLRDVEWRIGPGERTGIVGANGAGKSTLLGLITGAVQPESGKVKRGKTVRLGMLDQSGAELAPLTGERVADVLGRLRSDYEVDGREVTPAQLLERLGFAGGQLSARVGELSGGQRRRCRSCSRCWPNPTCCSLTNRPMTSTPTCWRPPKTCSTPGPAR